MGDNISLNGIGEQSVDAEVGVNSYSTPSFLVWNWCLLLCRRWVLALIFRSVSRVLRLLSRLYSSRYRNSSDSLRAIE